MAPVLFTGRIADITIYIRSGVVVSQVTKLLFFIDNLSSSWTIYISIKKIQKSPSTIIYILKEVAHARVERTFTHLFGGSRQKAG